MELGGCRWNTPCQLTAVRAASPAGAGGPGAGRAGWGRRAQSISRWGRGPPAWQSFRTCLIPDREVRVVEGEAWQTST